MSTAWHVLEAIVGLSASPAEWRAQLGEDFEAFTPFLQTAPETPGESGIWQLDRAKLGRALCTAFGLAPKRAEFPLPATGQIGSWSAEAVPAILTIQRDRREFRAVVAELVARLRRPFVLLAPTSGHLDAACQELLGAVEAGFFGLETHALLSRSGSIQARRLPDEMFAPFTPRPAEPPDEDVARQALALLAKLDGDPVVKNPSVLTVFRLYCVEGLSADQIVQKCHSSKGTVIRRLQLIQARTGVAPAGLRRLSPHLAKMEDELADSRTRRVYRKGVVYGEDEADEAGD